MNSVVVRSLIRQKMIQKSRGSLLLLHHSLWALLFVHYFPVTQKCAMQILNRNLPSKDDIVHMPLAMVIFSHTIYFLDDLDQQHVCQI